MGKIFYEKDTDLRILTGKTIAVFGYGSQGSAQANNMRESGVKVIVGLRKDGSSWKKAKEDGFEVYSFEDAAQKADMIHFLIPDEKHKEIFDAIAPFILPGKTLICSHGFNFHFNIIKPPKGVDVIMVAPKAPGPTVRSEYVKGFGVPALVAVYRNASGKALEKALAIAKANGHAKVGIIQTTFQDETETDLFGEQTVLCGGVIELMKTGFDTLVTAGYPPEVAYFECVHEMKLIVDLIYKNGIYGMFSKVSNTAKYGGLTVGPKIITKDTKKIMRQTLKKIQNGSFAKEWIDKEYKKNKLKNLHRKMEEVYKWQVEKVGRKIRQFAGLENKK